VPYPRYSSVAFGPGPITPAVKTIIIANVAVFLLTFALPGLVIPLFGLSPADVIERGRIWQLATYLFVHSPSSLMHIVFNMLAVWMFGVDLERRWGTIGFTKFYFVCGVGAALCTVLVSLAPYDWAADTYQSATIGASGAVYGLLMAWALLFPYREILFMFIFPLQARMFVLIVGAIAFLSAVGSSGTGVSNLAHLGGLLAGWFYLKGPGDLRQEIRYRVMKWWMDRMRKKFNVHRGGRDDDWTRRIH
jgi:membrane associated rhomboid family serine protease